MNNLNQQIVLKSYCCTVCNKKFSTEAGREMHFKMKHPQCEVCGSLEVEKGGYMCQYCIDDSITYK